MNARLSARLMRYSIEHATESAGANRRRKRGNGDVYAMCAVLLMLAALVVICG